MLMKIPPFSLYNKKLHRDIGNAVGKFFCIDWNREKLDRIASVDSFLLALPNFILMTKFLLRPELTSRVE